MICFRVKMLRALLYFRMSGSFRTIELSDANYESSGLRFLTIKTPHLKGRGDICIYVPDVAESVKDLPIYILLHGVYGSAWIWAMKGGAHHTAKQMMETSAIKPAVIAMPSDGLWGDGSAYRAHHEKQFDQWIVNDVIKAVKENIPQASSSNQACIAGLSMGGYGALFLGARYPEVFSAISAHSAITRIEQMALFVEESISSYPQESAQSEIVDLFTQNAHILPELRFDCGVDDELIEHNRKLHQQLRDLEIPHIYEEFSGGHEWPYWIKHLRETYRFFDAVLSKKRGD